MKKIFLAMLLVAAITAVAQTAPAPAQQPQPSPSQPAAAPQQTKEIKDPAEYNAYIGALGQQDPAAKISGFEAFITQYPNTVMKEEALEQLMNAYQQTGNQAKVVETAQKVLQANPNNLKALVLLAYGKRLNAKTPQDLAEAAQYGEKGLQLLPTVPKPEGISDADFQKFKTQATAIFNGAVGMSAYQNKDYAKAEQYLRAAVEADPNDVTNIYPLALA